jgi:hypothetical protein
MAFSGGNIADVSLDATPGGALVDYSEYIHSIILNSDREEVTLKRLGSFADARLTQSIAHGGTIEGHYDPVVIAMLRAHMDQAVPVSCSLQWDPQSTVPLGVRRTAEIFFTHLEEETGAEDAARWSADFVVDGALTTTAQAA